MNRSVPVLGLMLSACNPAPASDAPQQAAAPGAPAPADASAGSSGAGLIYANPTVPLDPASVQGKWSFDRTCASGDGMQLGGNGMAAFDEWGIGHWAIDPEGRLVLILRETKPGVDLTGLEPRLVLTFAASASAGDYLKGTFAEVRADMPAREIDAKRCP